MKFFKTNLSKADLSKFLNSKGYSVNTVTSSKNTGNMVGVHANVELNSHMSQSYLVTTTDDYNIIVTLHNGNMSPMYNELGGIEQSICSITSNNIIMLLEPSVKDEMIAVRWLANNPDKLGEMVTKVANMQTQMINDQRKEIDQLDWDMSNLLENLTSKGKNILKMYAPRFKENSKLRSINRFIEDLNTKSRNKKL